MLIVRIKPNKSESFQTYCIKLARVNGYPFIKFSNQIREEVKLYNLQNPKNKIRKPELIRDVTGYSEVLNVVDFFICYQSHKPFIEFTKIKFCPQCFPAQEDFPLYWSLKHYLVCVTHESLLINSCSHCNHGFTGETLRRMCCLKCFKSLEEMYSEQVEVDKYSKLFFAAFSSFQGNTFEFTSILNSKLKNSLEDVLKIEKRNGLSFDGWGTSEIQRTKSTLAVRYEKQLTCDPTGLSEIQKEVADTLLEYSVKKT
jgi:hypothetical protein